MERKFIFFIFVCCVIGYIGVMYIMVNSTKPKLSVPEKIMESVVFVNDASGVVVYSDDDRSLILSAYHVIKEDIKDDKCLDCNSDIEIRYFYITLKNNDVYIEEETYKTVGTALNEKLDLALLEIKPHKKLVYSKIIFDPKNYPKLGDDIWVGANPNGNYRSLKKGIVSSVKNRLSNYYVPVWEVSGGVAFGSSGGGVFNMDGKVFGIVKSVNMLFTSQCFDKIEGASIFSECVEIPQSFIALITPPEIIGGFILNSQYRKYFVGKR